MSNITVKEQILLKYQDLTTVVDKTNVDLEKMIVKNRVTVPRDFRREMRRIREIAVDIGRLTAELEKNMRDDKAARKSNKNA
jgi:hypothetical protein